MKFKIHIWGPKDRGKLPPECLKINTTSISTDFGKAFSPFLNQGPIKLFGLTAHNVENLWQFSKVHPQHVGKFREWCAWRDAGLADTKAHRYPMGKDAKPEFTYVSGLGKLSYVEARRKLYIPAYEQKLKLYCTRELQTLADLLTLTDIWLFDFDGRITEQSFEEIIEDQSNKMGHAFVIKKFLEDNYDRYYSPTLAAQTS
jgi:hypothetical protein